MRTLRNNVQLIGHLGAQPTIRTAANGAKLVRFNMATTDAYKTREGTFKEETFWHHIIAWGKIADQMEKQLGKGSFILLEGQLTYREYTDPGSNERKFFTEIRAGNFILLDKKAKNVQVTEDVVMEEDLPF